MPNLLCVANYFLSHGGGVEQVAHLLARELANQPGWNVTLAAHGTAPVNSDYAVRPLRCWDGVERRTGLPIMLTDPRDLGMLRSAVRKADVVLLHDNVYLSHLAVQQAARSWGKPVVIVKHTGTVRFRSSSARALQAVVRQSLVVPSLKRSDAVVFVTEAKRQSFKTRELPRRVETIVNGIDTALFCPSQRREAPNIDVLFVGRFVEKKGLAVVRELARLAPGLSYVCAGFGPDDPSGWQLPNVETMLRPSREALAHAYASARLFVLPAETEGAPLVLYEALASGTRVLASATSHTHDPDIDALVEFLPIDLSDPVATAGVWCRAIQARLDRPVDPDASHRIIRERCGIEAMAARYREVITTVLDGC